MNTTTAPIRVLLADDHAIVRQGLKQILGDLPELGTVGEVVQAKAMALVTATRRDVISDVIAKMKQYDVSQLPVVEDGRLVGMISEVDLLNYLLEGHHRTSDPIEAIIDPAPPVVDPAAAVDTLADVFLSANAAVVVDLGAVVGIVTKIDVIDHLAKRMRP